MANEGDMAQTVGGQLAELRGSVNTYIEEARRANDEARQSRKAMYEKLDGINERLANLDGRVSHNEIDIAEMKPQVSELTKESHRRKGRMVAVGVSASLLGWIAAYFKDHIFSGFK